MLYRLFISHKGQCAGLYLCIFHAPMILAGSVPFSMYMIPPDHVYVEIISVSLFNAETVYVSCQPDTQPSGSQLLLQLNADYTEIMIIGQQDAITQISQH